MSLNAYAILGLSTTSSETEVRTAYRKLAMQHHPDRNQGSRESTIKFQQIKAAFEEIEKAGFMPPHQAPQSGPGASGFQRQWDKPSSPGNTWRDRGDIHDIFNELKGSNRAADPRARAAPDYTQFKNGSDLVARVSIREAFTGFTMVVPEHHLNGMVQNSTIHIDPGSPDGYRRPYLTAGGKTVNVTTRIDAGEFSLRGFGDQNNIFSAGLRIGDVEILREMDAIDLITGTWIETTDFLGEKLSVRIPAGFNPLHRLKIANKGYYGWLQEYNRPSTARMDMYVKLNAVFKPPAEIDPDKIKKLYQTLQDK